jgi:hypothetical protein
MTRSNADVCSIRKQGHQIIIDTRKSRIWQAHPHRLPPYEELT